MSSKMLHSKNVQDAAISGRGLGEPLHLAIAVAKAPMTAAGSVPMPSPKQVHSFSASSGAAWIEADTSRIAQVNFMLAATCDYVSVEIPRHV
jgi:hypothetical protein